MITVYDDLERKKREFTPLSGNRVNMYVCGVTVYGPCHIGHARAYIAFDIIHRWLAYRGYDVFHIQNFTDVDDKIIAKANELGVSISDVSEKYIAEYFEDMDAMGVLRATVFPRATEYIPDMIGMVKTLIAKGFAYEDDGNVFYDVAQFPGYGKLSGRGMNELPVQEQAPGKRNPADFALWKKSGDGEPGWESPWGTGRPGWHLECSAMSLKLAGGPLDIHGGGMDLIFPHHENEIAQSEAMSGEQFARYWMHNGFIEVDKEKMSKSLGNITTVREALQKTSGATLRYMFLGAHYRMPLNFSFDRAGEADAALSRLKSFLSTSSSLIAKASSGAAVSNGTAEAIRDLSSAIETARGEFEKAMDDDFNTPAALASVFALVRKANSFASAASVEYSGAIPTAAADALKAVSDSVLSLTGLLGIDLSSTGQPGHAEDTETIGKLMDILIEARAEARKQKNWAMSDFIRDRLASAGITLMDRPDGTVWKKD